MGDNKEQGNNPSVRIWLCGPFRIEWIDPATGETLPAQQDEQGRDVAQTHALLKLLLCQPERQAHRDWIMEQFWPDHDSTIATHRIENICSSLRKLLTPPTGGESLLRSQRGRRNRGTLYTLADYPQIWVDSDAIAWNIQQAARMDRFGDESLPFWQRAFDLLTRGPLLADEPYAEWVTERRELHEGFYRQCVHALSQLYMARYGEAGKAEALLLLRTYWQKHKTDEDALRPLLELLGEQERYQEAEAYYQQFLCALAELNPTEDGKPRKPDARTSDIHDYLGTKQIQRRPIIGTHSLLHGIDERYIPFSPVISQDIIGESQSPSPILPGLALESDNETVKRREATRTIAAFGLQLLGLPVREQFIQSLITTLSVNEETLAHLEQLGDVCWRLANDSQAMMVAQILPTFLPKLTLLAGQPSPHQRKIASLVTRGYILAAEVEKKNVPLMQSYCEYAVIYSQITDDNCIKADALRQKATIALIAKEPSHAVMTYQQALPMVEKVSPLLRSRIYLGTGSAYARSGQKQEALRYLGLAHDSYPDLPEDDPAFLYLATSSDKAALHLYEALTYSDLQQPKDAWNVLMQVDGIQPKIPMVESTRIEFLNLQAKTAGLSGDMERSCEYLRASVKAAKKSGYEIWVQEAYDVYLTLCQIWPYEKQVKSLAMLFQ